VARVRRDRLDMFRRICASHLKVRADLATVAVAVVARYGPPAINT
jgi:hypothetical protein